MFGGATQYVNTLDAILEFIVSHHPTTDELVGWHRGTFERVSSRDSIMRRVSYLQQVGFIQQDGERWVLGTAGREYVQENDLETLLRIMCTRNVGLRSLMYALAAGPMTIAGISEQQLDTHPELGWSRGETDMALQRVNWLRSMGFVEKRGGGYALTDTGHRFVDEAVTEWTDTAWISDATDDGMTADVYETTVQARAVDQEFREVALARYDRTCPVSGVDYSGLLDVAHVLSWSDYPEYRADLSNVLALSKTHHAAFDRKLFTIDRDYQLHVNPEFETESELLQRTLLDQDKKHIQLPERAQIAPTFLEQHNQQLEWWPA
jgi:putative restriction endonuclease